MRMKILFLGQPKNLEPWFGDVVTAVGEEHQVILWQADTPFGPQIDDIQVVVDQGGGMATRAMVDEYVAWHDRHFDPVLTEQNFVDPRGRSAGRVGPERPKRDDRGSGRDLLPRFPRFACWPPPRSRCLPHHGPASEAPDEAQPCCPVARRAGLPSAPGLM